MRTHIYHSPNRNIRHELLVLLQHLVDPNRHHCSATHSLSTARSMIIAYFPRMEVIKADVCLSPKSSLKMTWPAHFKIRPNQSHSAALIELEGCKVNKHFQIRFFCVIQAMFTLHVALQIDFTSFNCKTDKTQQEH